MAVIGRFEAENGGYSGWIDTLLMHLNPVFFKRQEKGANFVVIGPGNTELGAAWVKTGEYGDFVSVKLDCPSLASPINCVMALRRDDGVFLLRWERRVLGGVS